MTRTLSPVLGAVVEALEMEQPQIVSMSDLRELVNDLGVGSEPRLVAHRLRQQGWLLETGVRGVWEFAPGSHAGPYGRGDPLGAVKSVIRRHPELQLAVALSSAAWALGYADRAPRRPDVALPPGGPVPHALAHVARVGRFEARLELTEAKGTWVHRPESVLVHMAHRPKDVRSWASAAEWIPDLADGADPDAVTVEVRGRPAATRARLGYLLQTLRPDIAEPLRRAATSKTWFGPRGELKRHSQSWHMADTLLPFDPATLRVHD